MNSRERTLAVINRKLPDRIPVDCIHVENAAEIAEYLKISSDQESVLKTLGIDGRVVGPGKYTGTMPDSIYCEAVDEWGTAAEQDYGFAHRYPLESVSELSEIEAYHWPLPSKYDFAESAQTAKSIVQSGTATRGPYWKPIFCRMSSLFGMEETMVTMMTEPGIFEAALEKVVDHTYEYCNHLISAHGENLDVFCLGDDFATQRGLMISPDLWRKFLKPCYEKLFSLAKKAGKPVWFHSCGDITSVLPDLIDIGMDVWETVQLHTLPISAEKLKNEYGKDITFFGGINTQNLPFASPAEIEAEVLKCIDVLGKNGGYICGPDHHIKYDIPAIKAITLFNTATGFRKDGYTLG